MSLVTAFAGGGSKDEDEPWGQISAIEKQELRELVKFKTTLTKMISATKIQKNVSKDIKNGLPALVEVYDSLFLCREKRIKIRSDLLKSPPGPGAKRKRVAATSPKMDAGPSASNDDSCESDTNSASSTRTFIGNKPFRRPSLTDEGAEDSDGCMHETETLNPWRIQGKLNRRNRAGEQPKNGTDKFIPGRKEPQLGEENRRRIRPISRRNEAVIIPVSEGKSYAEMLKEVRGKLSSAPADVSSVRKTQKGDVLVELTSKGEGTLMLAKALKDALGESSGVRALVPQADLEIKDLDAMTEKDDVTEAVRKALPEYNGQLNVYVTKPNSREQRMAIVTLDEEAATMLLNQSRIRIGWGSSRSMLQVPWLWPPGKGLSRAGQDQNMFQMWIRGPPGCRMHGGPNLYPLQGGRTSSSGLDAYSRL
ncbi:unnamed protein product [Nesidiocoris tenuis]|uniref:Uncharacterized protein n=1 Tax=Nesidiocoris tenuis TaxID=355587 RepID=A0A6H5H2C4_9HEMI|nr:unnamed protein product [Nesidiocoris tenuis]